MGMTLEFKRTINDMKETTINYVEMIPANIMTEPGPVDMPPVEMTPIDQVVVEPSPATVVM